MVGGKRHQVTVRLSQETFSRLKAVAEHVRRDKAWVLRDALERHLPAMEDAMRANAETALKHDIQALSKLIQERVGEPDHLLLKEILSRLREELSIEENEHFFRRD